MLYESVAECSHKHAADQIISWRSQFSRRRHSATQNPYESQCSTEIRTDSGIIHDL